MLKIKIRIELELNREWLYGDPDDEPIGERNFVISQDYFISIFPQLFPDYKEDMDWFLDTYEPETDGEKIYRRAKADGKIIDEFNTIINN